MWLGTPAVGAVVGGKYRLTRPLGSGGMSLVFAAENAVTEKPVALKFLLASVANRPGAKERLLREARAGSRIKHRNVVNVYDVGFEGETMFLVMDLLEGQTLSAVLESTTMRISALLRLLIPAMRGVAEAHRQGVIHRDIKPDNIFLAREVDHEEPVATVLDFGVAKVEGDSLRTRSGDASGTPMFMSAEQMRGVRDLDARVDVYAFGVILYMALSGRLPVVAESLPELIYKLTSTHALPLNALRPELPLELSDVVGRAIARDREERTPTLEQLICELTSFAQRGDELGFTRRVHDACEVAPMPTTVPAGMSSEEPNDVGQQSPLRVSSGPQAAPMMRHRWAVASLVLVALATLITTAASKQSASPKSSPVRVATPATVAMLAAPHVEATSALADSSRISTDAGTRPPIPDALPMAPVTVSRKLPNARARSSRQAVAVEALPPSEAPKRRRLLREDFFELPADP